MRRGYVVGGEGNKRGWGELDYNVLYACMELAKNECTITKGGISGHQ